MPRVLIPLVSMSLLNACGVDALGGDRDPGHGTQAAALERFGELSVLTYNVAGMPEGLSSSSPEAYIPLISPLLNAYELVLVQEDFWYHWDLVSRVTHPHLSLPYRDEPNLLDMGDGLNQLSRLPFTAYDRKMWKKCSGTISCSSDCMTGKGFTFSVLTLADGLDVHLYNLHMDAGSCDGDIAARQEQVEQLLERIETDSSSAPLIIAGDTNLSGSRPADMAMLENFLETIGTQDVCRTLGCGIESLDRVLVRGNERLILTPLAWSQPPEFVDGATGAALSDHLPVHARIGWEQKR